MKTQNEKWNQLKLTTDNIMTEPAKQAEKNVTTHSEIPSGRRKRRPPIEVVELNLYELLGEKHKPS